MRHNPKTRTTRTTPFPRYYPGNLVTLARYLPPLLSGTQVVIRQAINTGREYRYQVEASEYDADPIWAYEEDLRPPLAVEG